MQGHSPSRSEVFADAFTEESVRDLGKGFKEQGLDLAVPEVPGDPERGELWVAGVRLKGQFGLCESVFAAKQFARHLPSQA